MYPMRCAPVVLLAAGTTILTGLVAIWASPASALEGEVRIHDPSTIVQCDGKFYTYGTGGSCLVSDDGWTWRRGARPSRSGIAPDVIHLGDRYFMYVARNVGGAAPGGL